jgi:hypothetical protein
MTDRIEYFGGTFHGHMLVTGHPRTPVPFQRELWFDQDIDGRWLVAVTDVNARDDGQLGAIVVRDEAVGRFIEMVQELIAEPEKFTDEPVFAGPIWIGHHCN